MKTVVVFDYGFGNVRSMVRALADQGARRDAHVRLPAGTWRRMALWCPA